MQWLLQTAKRKKRIRRKVGSFWFHSDVSYCIRTAAEAYSIVSFCKYECSELEASDYGIAGNIYKIASDPLSSTLWVAE